MSVRTVTALLTLPAAIAIGAATLPSQDKSAKPEKPAASKPAKTRTVSPEERADALARAS